MKHWLLLLVAGVVAVIGGVVALLNPVVATFTATQIIAWLFIVMGALQVVAAFGSMAVGSRIWTAVLGVLAVLIGFWILSNPVVGTVALTWTIAILFLVEGVAKLVLAFATRGSPYFWALLLSGAISVLLGGMILAHFPASAMTIPGIILAIDLISTGAAIVALALHLRTRDVSA